MHVDVPVAGLAPAAPAARRARGQLEDERAARQEPAPGVVDEVVERLPAGRSGDQGGGRLPVDDLGGRVGGRHIGRVGDDHRQRPGQVVGQGVEPIALHQADPGAGRRCRPC